MLNFNVQTSAFEHWANVVGNVRKAEGNIRSNDLNLFKFSGGIRVTLGLTQSMSA